MPDTSPERRSLRGQIARAVGLGEIDRAEELRRDLRAANCAEFIQRTVNAAPPLTDEQLSRLAEILVPRKRSAR